MSILDADTPWKDLLDRYFEAFMAFFFPAAYEQIDWARGYEFLDKELQKITADAALGRRVVDKLVKVWLKSGEDIVALIHAEVQGERETDFSERVYLYHHRISDRFNQRVATFAILTDRHRRWRPREFAYELLGTKITLRFSVVKLLDYRDRWEELERSDNPFAVVVMAHLRLLETRRDAHKRLEWKLILTKMLYDRGYIERDVIELFRFLDWLMFLPEGLQTEYRDEIDRFEEERKMPYVTTIERMGIEKGMQKGRQEGRQEGGVEVALSLLQLRFGELSEENEALVRALPFERIKQLSIALLGFQSVDELNAWLRASQDQPTEAR